MLHQRGPADVRRGPRRDGNKTAFSYNGSNQETQVTFTPHGASAPTRTVTASYTGSYLTGLSQSAGG